MSIYRDPEKIAAYLESWIKEKFAEAGASRAVLGISVGIDSALLAAGIAGIIQPQVSALLHNGTTIALAAESARRL